MPAAAAPSFPSAESPGNTSPATRAISRNCRRAISVALSDAGMSSIRFSGDSRPPASASSSGGARARQQLESPVVRRHGEGDRREPGHAVRQQRRQPLVHQPSLERETRRGATRRAIFTRSISSSSARGIADHFACTSSSGSSASSSGLAEHAVRRLARAAAAAGARARPDSGIRPPSTAGSHPSSMSAPAHPRLHVAHAHELQRRAGEEERVARREPRDERLLHRAERAPPRHTAR